MIVNNNLINLYFYFFSETKHNNNYTNNIQYTSNINIK